MHNKLWRNWLFDLLLALFVLAGGALVYLWLDAVVGALSWSGFWKMARKYWRMGLAEQYRSWVKGAFLKALQQLVPELEESDLAPGGSGVRAQAVDRQGNLLDDFHFVHSGNMIHVCNVPSPAATASLEIGKAIVDMLAQRFAMSSANDTSVLPQHVNL